MSNFAEVCIVCSKKIKWMEPDIKWIEEFIYRAYTQEAVEASNELAVEEALWHERIGQE